MLIFFNIQTRYIHFFNKNKLDMYLYLLKIKKSIYIIGDMDEAIECNFEEHFSVK